MPELPTGTVTFLFTDLEGSTRLWEEHPEAMKAALAVHDEILRGSVETNHGHVVKTTGDGVHAVFAAPGDAVNAAVAGQRGLDAAAWGATGALRVRMGLHTGSAELRAGDYYGPVLNRAARLMAAAHGGQVVSSYATADLVRDAPSGSVSFLDLGEHRLRDLGRAERVFQVTHPELQSEFPALRTLDAFPGNLPLQLTGFIGRDAEVRAVTKLLGSSRVVTLTGPGGVGKTRLALQAAAESIGGFHEGAWFVDLAPIDEPGLVTATVAGALQIPEPRQGTVEDALLVALRTQRLLIVLDNCEHLVDAATSFVDLVVHHCVEVTVLVTSREALGLVGEDTFPVKPLAVPPADEFGDLASLQANEAVRLFVERGASARHGFELTVENASAVGEVCRRLDGIPLAIELAAARVQAMSPTDILSRLNERFRLLAQGRRSGLARHQTLRGAVDWSYGLLEPAEQLVFERCSVFAGGFTLDAAEFVVAGDGVDALDVIDLVSSLVAKSMVVADDAGDRVRYRILETLRDYGADRLGERGSTEQLRRRHAVHYLAFAEEVGPRLSGSDPEGIREAIDDEYDNLRAALAWSEDTADDDTLVRLVRALGLYWYQRGLWRQGLTWIQAARATDSGHTASIVEAWLDAFAGAMAAQLCRWEEALQLLQASLESTRSAGGPSVPLASHSLALEALEGNRPVEAVAYAEQALAASRQRDDRYWEIFTLTGFSLMVSLTEEGAGMELADEAVGLARAQRNGYLLSHALVAGGVSRLRADPAGAILVLDEAVTSHSGSPNTLLQSLFFRGLSHLRLGHVGQAAADLDAALNQARVIGNDYYLAMVLTAAAGIFSRRDEQQEAGIRLLAAADRLRDQAGLVGAPRDIAMQQSVSERLERAIGSEAFRQAWTLGRQASLEEAIALARAELDEISADHP